MEKCVLEKMNTYFYKVNGHITPGRSYHYCCEVKIKIKNTSKN